MIADPTSAEAKEIVRLVENDLASARAFVTRLVAIRDALWAATVTAATAFSGLAIANHRPVIAYCGAAVVALLAVAEVQNDIVFRRLRGVTRRLETLLRHYISALRETGVTEAAARRRFRNSINRYSFGTEASLRRASRAAYVASTLKRPRWYLHVAMALLFLGLGGTIASPDRSGDVCVAGLQGAIVRIDTLPQLKSGTFAVVPCE